MSFLETPRFPDNIAYGSRGGPMYSTRIIRVHSGHTKRLARWTYPLHQYDVSYGIRTQSDVYAVLEMFHACGAREHQFRFQDFQDYNSTGDMRTGISATDQTLGTGDGAEKDFQLIKTYTKGALSRTRKITKPLAGALVSLDDAPQGSGWTLDTTTGLLSFTVAPGAGVVVKAGFEFDVPVEFADDALDIQWDFNRLQSTSIVLAEIRI
jgi:uncharacterized protein (TIGR02217 family)